MIEHGAVSFEEVLDLISGLERLWVRLSVARGDEGWTVLAYELVAPIEPPSWQDLTWDYPAAMFHSFSVTGEVVAQWLESGRIALHDREVTLSGLPREPPNQQVTVRGLASKQPWGGYEPLPWPRPVTRCPQEASVPSRRRTCLSRPTARRSSVSITQRRRFQSDMEPVAQSVTNPFVQVARPDRPSGQGDGPSW